MNSLNSKKLLVSLLCAMTLALSACSSKSSSAPSGDAGDLNGGNRASDVSSSTPPNDSNWGGRAELNIASSSTFRDFAGYEIDDLRDVALYMNLTQTGPDSDPVFYGDLRISYNYVVTHGEFSATPGLQETRYKFPRFEAPLYDSTVLDSNIYNPQKFKNPHDGVRFNKFYDVNGQAHFVAFFQEPEFVSWGVYNWNPSVVAGAVMVIIDQVDDLGYEGKVYFKNYRFNESQKVPYNCWDITSSFSPWNCGDLLVNGKIDPANNITPSKYTELGSFYGLPPERVFN